VCRPRSEIRQTIETFTVIAVIWKSGPSLTLLFLSSAKTSRFSLASKDAKKKTRVSFRVKTAGWVRWSKQMREILGSRVHSQTRSQNSEKRLLTSCPSVRMEQLGSYWTLFRVILYLSIFRKSVEKIQDPLKSYKYNKYST
jgi:hypothetical protein